MGKGGIVRWWVKASAAVETGGETVLKVLEREVADSKSKTTDVGASSTNIPSIVLGGSGRRPQSRVPN